MALYKRHVLGRQAENAACRFLETNGLTLLEQNFHCSYGEIDLIMLDRDDIVFVEVRYRQSANYGSALESINSRKVSKLIKTAKYFLQSKKWLFNTSSRFDVVAIQPETGKMQLEWIKNAFPVDL